jgi:hypothetical protein
LYFPISKISITKKGGWCGSGVVPEFKLGYKKKKKKERKGKGRKVRSCEDEDCGRLLKFGKTGVTP